MTTTERWIEYQPLDELRPDPRNPKGHDVAGLRASLGRFGYAEPITVDERTGLLVSGHGRRELLLDDFAAGSAVPTGCGWQRTTGGWSRWSGAGRAATTPKLWKSS
jgi:hypothetical protein